MAFKMRGAPMKRNFGIGAPKLKDDKLEVGSTQETNIESDRLYKDQDGYEVKSAGMVRLERAEPSKDSPQWDAWNKTYQKAKARHVASVKSGKTK